MNKATNVRGATPVESASRRCGGPVPQMDENGVYRDLVGVRSTESKGHGMSRALCLLPVVVVSCRTVVMTGPHAALLESDVPSRKGRGRSCLVSRIVPFRHGQRGSRA